MGFTIAPVERESTIVSVPDEVATSLEEAWTYLQEHPDHVFLATFEDEKDGETVTRSAADALKLFRRQADTYLSTRDGGALVLRKIRTDSLGEDAMRFTLITPDQVKPRSAPKPGSAKPGPKPGQRKAS